METTERNYNELYSNGNGCLEVFVHAGLHNIFAATNVKTKERKRFNSLKDLEAYLYNKEYHLVMTDRATIFARNIMEGQSPLSIIDLATRRDGTPKEICFSRDNRTYTGWIIGKNLGDKREVVVRCNCPGAYANATGHKTVTVPVENIILLSDY
jgi:predicted kinase